MACPPVQWNGDSLRRRTNLKAASYIRVSTEEQANEGHSLDAQRTIIAEFCGEPGWTWTASTWTPGCRQGRRPPRPPAAVGGRRGGAFDLVIVHAVDRFYRNLQGLLSALDRLNQPGSALCRSPRTSISPPVGQLTLAVLGTLARST